MTVYIALLRGINVGGHNKIKMADLKVLLEQLGLQRVQTYIQSGNILFASEASAAELRDQIEQAIQRAYGFTSTVILRTSAELKQLLADCPYQASTPEEGKRIQVTLLLEAADPRVSEVLSAGKNEGDEFQVHGRDIYFLFRQPMLESKLASNVQKLGATVTSRNWNTMKKLEELAEAMAV
jgi:uncharacterized protein (DUF1697 family)